MHRLKSNLVPAAAPPPARKGQIISVGNLFIMTVTNIINNNIMIYQKLLKIILIDHGSGFLTTKDLGRLLLYTSKALTAAVEGCTGEESFIWKHLVEPIGEHIWRTNIWISFWNRQNRSSWRQLLNLTGQSRADQDLWSTNPAIISFLWRPKYALISAHAKVANAYLNPFSFPKSSKDPIFRNSLKLEIWT